ncbi:hypothetical protein OAO87_03470, partial [bacterium]|nr:hypothetical protein [bacterium]
ARGRARAAASAAEAVASAATAASAAATWVVAARATACMYRGLLPGVSAFAQCLNRRAVDSAGLSAR